MKILSNLFIAGLALLCVTSCKKNKEEISKTQLLTAANWRLIGHTSTNNTTGVTTDNYSSSPACAKDNEFTFTTAGVHEYTEGATKCNPADPQVIYFASWKFLNNETVIEVVTGGLRLEYKVLGLSASELYMEASNATATDRVRFIH